MSERIQKRKRKKKYFITYFAIILLLVTSIYLYKENTNHEKILKELELKLETRRGQEEFVSKHKGDLETIKTLKQEILGQQYKKEEYSKQISSFTDTLIKNQEKLDNLES